MDDDRKQFENQIISKKAMPTNDDNSSKKKNKKNKRREKEEEPQPPTHGQHPRNSVSNPPIPKDKRTEQEQALKDLCCILSNYKRSTVKKVLVDHDYDKSESMNSLLEMAPDNEEEEMWGKDFDNVGRIQKNKSEDKKVANTLINEVYDNLLKEEIEDINGREFEELFEEIADMIKEDQKVRGMGIYEINNFVDECNSVKQTLLVGFREELSSFDDFYQFDESYPLVAQTQDFIWSINKKQVREEKKLQEDFPFLGGDFKGRNIIDTIHLNEKRKKEEEAILFAPNKNPLPYYAKERSNGASIFNVDNKLNSERDLMALHKEFSDVPIRDLKFVYRTFVGDYNVCREFLIKFYDDKRNLRVPEISRTSSSVQKPAQRTHTSRLRKEEIDEELKQLSLREIRDEIDHVFKLRQALQITKLKIKSSNQKQQLDRMINEKNPLIKKLSLAARYKEVEAMQKSGNPLYIDLHGYREEEIDPLLDLATDMLREEYDRRNEKVKPKKVRGRLAVCLVAMTGKGLHSRGNRSILKPAAAEWSRLRDFDYEEEQDHIRIYIVVG